MMKLQAKASQLINCSMQAAFDAFVDPVKITQFWLESTSAPLSRHANVTWNFWVPGASEILTVNEIESPRLIAFTWSDGVEVRLEFGAHAADRTVVTATAEGFVGEDLAERVVDATEGFSIVLCDLKTLLESGRSAGLVRAKAELIAAAMARSKGDA